MNTTTDCLCITDPAVHRLTVAIQRLQTEQAAIRDANRTLVEYGLTSGSPEAHARLRAIEAEALTIAARLHALGIDDQAATGLILTTGVSP
ncbi:hypothetical protein ACPPVO_52010 [Dactylosporangium sp. McL0621]|uniref:hypothetical protein n=1 Tax=Dactylosporangium sp. McL0621 TaxID=3415678 RepID=UPI003CFB7E10